MKRTVTAKHLTLSPREIRAFLSNAQLALCETVSDESIPTVYYFKEHLVQCFQGSKLTPTELACVLVSAAWDIFDKGAGDGKTSRS